MKIRLRKVWDSLKDAFRGFSDDKVTKLSASLAYYTVFSLGPLLIVIIFLSGLFLGAEAVQGSIYAQLESFIGHSAAEQIQTIIKNASVSGKGGIAAVIGIITLLIGATTVFGELQDSMNAIWGVKARPKAGFMKIISTRLLSFGMIASLGFLLLVSLAVTAVVEAMGRRLQEVLPDAAVVVGYMINLVLTIVETTILFAGIFKVLPDIRIKWKNVWPGAIATSLLFLVGKFGISLYLAKSEIGDTYGAAGSLVILLLWIYYSAIILYFGAEFTRAYAVNNGVRIVPNKYAELEEKPTVAGAAVRQVTPSETGRRQQKQPVPQPARDQHGPPRKKTGNGRSTGIGTVIAGLALYFFNTAREKNTEED
ncbi:MAG TPA: YihY/virulence factor BrkB family protein [Flavisolibacter sp.]